MSLPFAKHPQQTSLHSKAKTHSPFLHGGQLDPTVESGIIAADEVSAVLSWKKEIKINNTTLWTWWQGFYLTVPVFALVLRCIWFDVQCMLVRNFVWYSQEGSCSQVRKDAAAGMCRYVCNNIVISAKDGIIFWSCLSRSSFILQMNTTHATVCPCSCCTGANSLMQQEAKCIWLVCSLFILLL